MLTLRFKKRADAATALVCVREDGSWTSGAVGAADGYGPVHDLAHYAVESTLGLTGGFLGLVARGWDLQDFEVRVLERIAKEPDGADAGIAEGLAGFLSGEAMSGRRSTAAELNWSLGQMYAAHGGEPPLEVSEETLAAIWQRLDALRAEWDALRPGETLERRFEPGKKREP
jgi:hypothetical protein